MKNPPLGHSQAAAEAVFGSTSRGTGDHLSDRDMLIADDNVNVLRARCARLTDQGWSVASYTFSKLRALASKGALFIQHLKLEAKITHDDGGRLRSLLDGFQPRNDYVPELRANRDLASLSHLVAGGRRGPLLAADILYVTVRNFGVLTLAQRGRFHFAYDEVLQSLCEEQVLDISAIGSLAKLRLLKCLYRSGTSECSRGALQDINDALKFLPSEYFPDWALTVPPTAILSLKQPPANASAYQVLRDLERRLVALEALIGTQSQNAELAKLASWIANPRAYSGLSASLAPELRLALERSAVRVISKARAHENGSSCKVSTQ